MFLREEIEEAIKNANKLYDACRDYRLMTKKGLDVDFDKLWKIAVKNNYSFWDMQTLMIYRLNTIFTTCQAPKPKIKTQKKLKMDQFRTEDVQENEVGELINQNLTKNKNLEQEMYWDVERAMKIPWLESVKMEEFFGDRNIILSFKCNAAYIINKKTVIVNGVNLKLKFFKFLSERMLVDVFSKDTSIYLRFGSVMMLGNEFLNFQPASYKRLINIKLALKLCQLLCRVEGKKQYYYFFEYGRNLLEKNGSIDNLIQEIYDNMGRPSEIRGFVNNLVSAWQKEEAVDLVANWLQQIYGHQNRSQNTRSKQVLAPPVQKPQEPQKPQKPQEPKIPVQEPKIHVQEPKIHVEQAQAQPKHDLPEPKKEKSPKKVKEDESLKLLAERFKDVTQEDGNIRIPIFGRFKNMKLPETLEEALEDVKEVDDLDVYIFVANEKAEDMKRNDLTQAMKAALIIYTMQMGNTDNSLFNLVNKALREKDRNKIEPWKKYIFLLLHALKVLEPTKSVELFRGANLKLENLGEKYEPGKVFTWTAFSSTSTSMVGAGKFLGNKEKVFWLLKLKEPFHGRSLKEFSEFPNEDEVLLPPNMRFKVIDILKLDNAHLIRCEQEEIKDKIINW